MNKVDTTVDALPCYLTLNSSVNILFTCHNLFYVSFVHSFYLHVVQSFASRNDQIFASFFFSPHLNDVLACSLASCPFS